MFENNIIKLRKLPPNIYYMWRNDIAVMCTTSPALDVYTPEETEKFVTAIVSQPNAKAFIIEYKETGKPVGIILLIQIDYKN